MGGGLRGGLFVFAALCLASVFCRRLCRTTTQWTSFSNGGGGGGAREE